MSFDTCALFNAQECRSDTQTGTRVSVTSWVVARAPVDGGRHEQVGRRDVHPVNLFCVTL